MRGKAEGLEFTEHTVWYWDGMKRGARYRVGDRVLASTDAGRRLGTVVSEEDRGRIGVELDADDAGGDDGGDDGGGV